MDEINLNYRELLLVLSSEIKTLKYYFGKNAKYEVILKELADFHEDEYKPFPKQKELLKQLGLKRNELMQLLADLYEDFQLSIFQSHRYKIKKTEYYINAETLDDHHWQIGLDRMEHIPSPGDVFRIPFIKSEYSNGYFWVREVDRKIENQVHTVSISISAKSDKDDK